MPALLFSIQFPQNCCQLLSSKTNNEEDKGKIPLSPLLSHNNARFLITFKTLNTFTLFSAACLVDGIQHPAHSDLEFDLRQVLVDEALNVSEVFVNIKIHLCQPLFSFFISSLHSSDAQRVQESYELVSVFEFLSDLRIVDDYVGQLQSCFDIIQL